MSVPAVNLRLERGTDFEATFNVTASDGSVFPLNNYTATAKIRKHPTATESKTFSTTITAATGEIKLNMTAANTLELTSGRNYYDVIITQVGVGRITKVFEGMITVVDTVSV
jgi:hypothetical protein